MTRVSETLTISCNIKAETSKAILIQTHTIEGEVGEHWIPLSQTEQIHRRNNITEGMYSDSVVITKWIAEKKGLV